MKKKIVMVLLAMTMAFSVTACGSIKDVVSTKYEDEKDEDEDEKDEDDGKEDSKQDLEEIKEDNDNKENNDDKEDNDTDETKDNEDEEKKPVSGVVLGGEFDKDYDGFEYIYCETLMTESEENESTGKMESESLLVFIPKADYASVNRDTAYAEDMGVDFRVTLNPYIRYEEEDYLPEENLALAEKLFQHGGKADKNLLQKYAGLKPEQLRNPDFYTAKMHDFIKFYQKEDI
mgnify:CR=1 FL=1